MTLEDWRSYSSCLRDPLWTCFPTFIRIFEPKKVFLGSLSPTSVIQQDTLPTFVYLKCLMATSRLVLGGAGGLSLQRSSIGTGAVIFHTAVTVRCIFAQVDTTCLIFRCWCSRKAAIFSNSLPHLAHPGLFSSWQAAALPQLRCCLLQRTGISWFSGRHYKCHTTKCVGSTIWHNSYRNEKWLSRRARLWNRRQVAAALRPVSTLIVTINVISTVFRRWLNGEILTKKCVLVNFLLSCTKLNLLQMLD